MSVERWSMESGRVVLVDLSHDAETVEALRDLLRSQGAVKVTDQEESPSTVGAVAEGENTTNKEMKEMSSQIIRSSLAPIYGKNDHRWDELAHWFEIHAEELIDDDGAVKASMDDLEPNERLSWWASRVAGIGPVPYWDVQFPAFPEGVAGPGWATSSEDLGPRVVTDEPVRVFRREFGSDGFEAAIEQEASYDPDSDYVSYGRVSAAVWVDGNTRVSVTEPVEALLIARLFLRAEVELQKLVP